MHEYEELNPPQGGDLAEHDGGKPPSKWPVIIGRICLGYALVGMICMPLSVLSVVLAPFFVRLSGAKDIELDSMMYVATMGPAVLLECVGVVLIVGAIKLLRRRPSALAWLKAWVVLRLALLTLNVVITVVAAPMLVDFNMQMQAFGQEMTEKNGGWAPPPKTEDQMWVQTVYITAGISLLVAIYPAFLGFFVSRRKIADEVQLW